MKVSSFLVTNLKKPKNEALQPFEIVKFRKKLEKKAKETFEMP